MADYALTPLARDDLASIFLYSHAEWGREQAELYLRHLFDIFAQLAEYPLAGRHRPDISERIRAHTTRAHIILYTIETDQIAIARVLHASRDVTNITLKE